MWLCMLSMSYRINQTLGTKLIMGHGWVLNHGGFPQIDRCTSRSFKTASPWLCSFCLPSIYQNALLWRYCCEWIFSGFQGRRIYNQRIFSATESVPILGSFQNHGHFWNLVLPVQEYQHPHRCWAEPWGRIHTSLIYIIGKSLWTSSV